MHHFDTPSFRITFSLRVIVPQITNLRQRERVRVPVPVLT